MNPIHSQKGFCKGLRPVDNSRAHLKFGDFLTGLPTAPLVDIAPAYNYPMDLNDQIGDCVVAAFDHFQQVVTGLLTGTELNFDQDMLIKFYQTQNPDFNINGTPETNGPGSSSDNGMNIQEFLEYLQQNGYIEGFAKIDHTNQAEVQSAIYIGLALMCGVTLQDAQMQQFQEGQPWNPVEGSPIDGGHGVPAVGFNNSPQVTFVTWAKLQQATEAFITNGVTEMWFVLTKYHVAHPNFRDNFDLEGFSKAVAEITGNEIIIKPTVQQSTINLIAGFEGFSSTPYKDTGGKWTIGYGFTEINGEPVAFNTPAISMAEADAMLAQIILGYALVVTNSIKVLLNQNQFDACVSLCYNIGMGGFAGSTVVKECNENNFPAAAQAFLLWDQVNGVVNQGLLNRRTVEKNLFLTPVAV